MSSCMQELPDFARFTSQLLHSEAHSISQGCQSGQMDLTVNQAGFALRRFESYPCKSLNSVIVGKRRRDEGTKSVTVEP